MKECYYEAAIRHLVDGSILHREECYDNAVYLFGNAAECALKSLIMVYCGKNGRLILQRRYGHDIENLIGDLYNFIVNSEEAAALDPVLGIKLQKFFLPEALFHDHPERRYAENGKFDSTDTEKCRDAAEFLTNEMIKQHIDGYI